MPIDQVALRRSLGIPDDAHRVLLFAESSHWDPNWLYTSEEYYRRFVARNLDLALDALACEPRRVYSVECLFFLRMYWERRPEQRERVRRLVNERRLRLTSSGVTTADTLLPSAEAILRDLLLGQEWLRRNGMDQEPRLAYFTDSFGCTPALPSLLRAAGFDRTAITRIDGMFFPGTDLESSKRFPRPGSSAARLLQVERSLDFVWRDMNGAEVLCHWNAFNYGQGDMLAHRGIGRIYIVPLAISARSERHVARRIGQYVRQLAPYSRTPYLFCPIGFDFVAPIPDLSALLDRYNRVRYPTTGVWAVNAGLDDYLALAECHRESLPVVELDPNPYWTGFYTSRPALKQQCRALVDRLLLAERLAVSPACGEAGLAALRELEPAWWDAATANHHDFITGTSPDAVVESEQRPWLERAMGLADAAIERLAPCAFQPSLASSPGPPAADERVRRGTADGRRWPVWSRHDGTVRIETPHYVVELAEEAGGGIVRAWTVGGAGAEPAPALLGISNDLVSYRDSGGLWRMGHEYRGGFLVPAERASQWSVSLAVREVDGSLQVVGEVQLDGETLRRTLWFHGDSPLIWGRVEGRAAPRRTVGLQFRTSPLAEQMAMAQPGGVVVRPPHKIYAPTFWPVQEFAHVQHRAGGGGFAVLCGAPSAISYDTDGRVELVALRNATRERAHGVVPLPANPATGHERVPYAFDYALLFTADGDWRANRLARLAQEMAWHPGRMEHERQTTGDEKAVRAASDLVVTALADDEGPRCGRTEERAGVGSADVTVIAIKPASRGEGIIVRLSSYAAPGGTVAVSLRGRAVRAASLCDARERDLEALAVRDGRVCLTMTGSVATVRLLVS